MIFCHPSMTAAQACAVARETGLDLMHNAATGNFRLEEKRAAAISYLRERGIYVLDQHTPKPDWGNGPKEAA